MLAEQGDHKAMQTLLDNQSAIDKKNTFLQPAFREVKSQIRFMSQTPELELIKEYMDKKAVFSKSLLQQGKSKEERDQKIGQLT